jgi:hypothetical protein
MEKDIEKLPEMQSENKKPAEVLSAGFFPSILELTNPPRVVNSSENRQLVR